MIRIGVIGYGTRIRWMVQEVERFGTARLRAIADPRADEIRSELQKDRDDVAYFKDADEMLQSAQIDAVMVGTRCSLHPEMAAKVARRGLPLFLEKPVATSMEGIELLRSTWKKHPVPVVVSFPLRVSPLVERVKAIVDSGAIGSIENIQAVNNVPYGDVYYADWYRDHNETGGLWLQKATHDFDYINYLLGERPRWVAAMKSRRVYGGDKPAGLKCRDCDEQRTCIESPFSLFYHRKARPTPFDDRRMCLFGEEIENEDNGSALLEYESGVQVAYSQNFFARNGAAARGARLLGYKGTIDFCWYRGDIRIYYHHEPRTETITYNDTHGHFGGDRRLAWNFLEVIEGTAESKSPLEAGIVSAITCLKARESSNTRQFCEISFE